MAAVADPPTARAPLTPPPPEDRPRRAVLVPAAVGAVLAAGLALRVLTASDLWLDEALTVTIARLPLGRIPWALRQDGAPPLYYVLLHLWTAVFGTSDVAVRLPSGLASAATLPVVWACGRRLGGRRAAWAATILLATNPFAIRYATETRMYALVAFEAALGALFVLRAHERPSVGRLACVAAVAAALLYTHYWALFLLGATGLWLLWRAFVAAPTWAGRVRSPHGLLAVAVAVGSLTWLPWVPTFLDQSAHTGTPWATPPGPSALVNVLSEFSGGMSEGARVLACFLVVLLVLGVLGQAVDGQRIELDVRGRRGGRALLAATMGAPSLAVVAGMLTGAAFVGRYASVVLPTFMLLAGLGAAVVADRRKLSLLLVAASLLGLWQAGSQATKDRTEAGVIAGYLATTAKPGDVVAFCPDQLGPGVLRLLGDRFASVAFPRGDDGRRIDWYDYGDVNDAASPAAFAELVAKRAGPHDVWLVSSHSYRTALVSCTEVEARLLALRPAGHQVVRQRPGKFFESAALIHYAAP